MKTMSDNINSNFNKKLKEQNNELKSNVNELNKRFENIYEKRESNF